MDPETILQFWFGQNLEDPVQVAERCKMWFMGDADLDQEIRRRFGHLPSLTAEGRLAAWQAAPRSCLALTLVLDQLPRNLYRGTPRAFAYDHRAVRVAKTGIGFGFDQQVHPLEAAFFYMPLEHAENPELQRSAVEKFRGLLPRAPRPLQKVFRGFYVYAIAHQAVIRRFGRFPHRNEILDRPSTPEEIAYLAEGGETFGSRRSSGGRPGNIVRPGNQSDICL